MLLQKAVDFWFTPLHELCHYFTAYVLQVPAEMESDCVIVDADIPLFKMILITIAPILAGSGVAVASVAIYLQSSRNELAIMAFSLQMIYACIQLSLIEQDAKDLVRLVMPERSNYQPVIYQR